MPMQIIFEGTTGANSLTPDNANTSPEYSSDSIGFEAKTLI
jgi:hypothetical protein